MNKREEGRLGEKIAEEYLKKKGYKILEKNFLTPLGEIDIIARKEKWLCFIEVKYRKGKKYGSPLVAVDFRKIERIKKLIDYYCLKEKISETPLRIEVVGITKENESFKIEHIENVSQ